MKRKSLVDAISPEVREFIEAGTPKPQIGEIESVPTPEEKAPRPVAKQRVEAPEEVAAPLITQSYRLPVALVSTLVRASMERKLPGKSRGPSRTLLPKQFYSGYKSTQASKLVCTMVRRESWLTSRFG